MGSDVRRLGDEVGAALTDVIGELEGLSRPAGADPSELSGSAEQVLLRVSGTDRKDAGVRRSPPPNSVIVVDDAFVYTTDELGRVVRAEATLTAGEPGERNDYAQHTLKGKLPGDDAGHLIARVLGGLGDQLNLVPMTRKVNREEYAAMERRWRRAVEQGKTVDLEIELEYDTDARRPISIVVSYEIAGQKPRTVPFDNDPTEEIEP
ncbi:DNA/RNA non-specific endonuclease [Haloactinopolyspora alba]|uniref:DNA/RNA non-specific endonuclease n=2 Tax=Haloactinopolyspora alba TaxID=648780 RepID=A0A2P8EFA1_9ACTN|nr:DNA/RNA non-specific endonuclease [Haloactinopolyspora alba]